MLISAVNPRQPSNPDPASMSAAVVSSSVKESASETELPEQSTKSLAPPVSPFGNDSRPARREARREHRLDGAAADVQPAQAEPGGIGH